MGVPFLLLLNLLHVAQVRCLPAVARGASAAQLAAAAEGALLQWSGGARCRFFKESEAPRVDLSANCSYSGGQPPSSACVAASRLFGRTDGHCGKCLRVTYRRPPSRTTACLRQECPGYDRSVLVQIVDAESRADFEVAQNAWAGQDGLCPYICSNSDECVTSPAFCSGGALLSGCYSAGKHVGYEEVDCPRAKPKRIVR